MSKLSINESLGDFTDIIKLDFEALKTIGNGGQKKIARIPAGGAVTLCYVDESVAVAGTSTLVIDVGTTTADPDEFIDALDVDAMTVPVANTGDLFTSNYMQAVSAVSSDTDIVIEVTDANIANITAGEIIIGLTILNPRRFA